MIRQDTLIKIVGGGLGTGPLARHPAARLGPDEQEVLSWMVESKGGGPVELSECLQEPGPDTPEVTVRDLEGVIQELVAAP